MSMMETWAQNSAQPKRSRASLSRRFGCLVSRLLPLPAGTRPARLDSHFSSISNRQPRRIETSVSHCKQTIGVHSNRQKIGGVTKRQFAAILAAFCTVLAPVSASAQQPQTPAPAPAQQQNLPSNPTFVLRAQSNVVRIDVEVTDGSGKADQGIARRSIRSHRRRQVSRKYRASPTPTSKKSRPRRKTTPSPSSCPLTTRGPAPLMPSRTPSATAA